MNELIKINNDNMVDGRSLHEFLQVGTEYRHWFPRMVEYGFVEGIDFRSKMTETSASGGRPSINHEMTIDMAKEISMLQRTERGKQARQYFLECEKRLKAMPVLSPAEQMAQGLLAAQKLLAEKEQRITEMTPKAIFADAVSASKASILIGDLAKLIRQNGVDVGQNRLFAWMRENGWLHKGGSSKNMPTQRGMEQGLFEIKETTINNPDGSIRVTRTTKVTGKGQQYFVNKFLA